MTKRKCNGIYSTFFYNMEQNKERKKNIYIVFVRHDNDAYIML